MAFQVILPRRLRCSTNHRCEIHIGAWITCVPSIWRVERGAHKWNPRRGCMLYLLLAREFRPPAGSCTGHIYWRKRPLFCRCIQPPTDFIWHTEVRVDLADGTCKALYIHPCTYSTIHVQCWALVSIPMKTFSVWAVRQHGLVQVLYSPYTKRL